jgi:hypothetical protein
LQQLRSLLGTKGEKLMHNMSPRNKRQWTNVRESAEVRKGYALARVERFIVDNQNTLKEALEVVSEAELLATFARHLKQLQRIREREQML